jgi:hypothetical protein
MAAVPSYSHHRPVTVSPVTESVVLPPKGLLMPSLAVLFDPSRVAIQLHPCPKCLGPMVLTQIKPSRIGYESHTFQGVNCDHVDKVVTATESMKWMSSGLGAPV